MLNENNLRYSELQKIAQDPTYAARLEAANKLVNTFIAAIGLGALTGGFHGISRLISGQSKLPPRDITAAGPVATPIAVPDEEEEKKKYKNLHLIKRAGEPGWLRRLVQDFFTNRPKDDWFFGANPTLWSGVPAFWALASLSLPAMYGTYRGVRGLFNQQREDEVAHDLDELKQEQKKTLREITAEKAASDLIDKELDELIDACLTKTADDQPGLFRRAFGPLLDVFSSIRQSGKTFTDPTYNLAAGIYGLYAPLAMLLSGTAAYNYLRARNPEDIMEKALRRREKERHGGVAPVYLTLDQKG